MKTPWRFLVDLTSRRKTPSEQLLLPASDATAGGGDAIESGHSSEPASAVQSSDTGAHAATVSPETQVEPIETAEEERQGDVRIGGSLPEAETATESTDAVLPPAVEEMRPAQKSRIKREKTVKQGRSAEAVQSASEAISAEKPPAAPSTRPAFFDEVAVLDDEIAALKAALAQKLKHQNAQLKTMLERFDVS